MFGVPRGLSIIISRYAGLAILSALITFFFIRPLTEDGMIKEDREVSFFFAVFIERPAHDH